MIVRYLLLLLMMLAMPLSQARAGDDDFVDPFEQQDQAKSFNKAMFDFNIGADHYVIKPVAETYHHLPDWSRAAVGNVLTNLSEPSNFVNGVLQLNPKVAFTSLWRFVLNTTFGMGGLIDFAGSNGNLKEQDTDFGETMASYGIGSGSYLVLPLAGPSTVRDALGTAVDWFLDPVGWYLTTPESLAQTGAEAIATRDDEAAMVDHFYYQTIDPYSATRAAYLQHQAFQK